MAAEDKLNTFYSLPGDGVYFLIFDNKLIALPNIYFIRNSIVYVDDGKSGEQPYSQTIDDLRKNGFYWLLMPSVQRDIGNTAPQKNQVWNTFDNSKALLIGAAEDNSSVYGIVLLGSEDQYYSDQMYSWDQDGVLIDVRDENLSLVSFIGNFDFSTFIEFN